jgi:hypothetical protein
MAQCFKDHLPRSLSPRGSGRSQDSLTHYNTQVFGELTDMVDIPRNFRLSLMPGNKTKADLDPPSGHHSVERPTGAESKITALEAGGLASTGATYQNRIGA